MKKLCAVVTAALMLGTTAWMGGTSTARADYQSDRDALCGPGETNACSIDIRDKNGVFVEGVSRATVDVVGTPNVTSKLQMYALTMSEIPYNWDRVGAYGSPVAFTTNAAGKATLTIPIPVLKAPDGATTPIAFQPVGATVQSITQHPIEPRRGGNHQPDLISVRSARGADRNTLTVVKDGSLEAEVSGGLTGDVYGVQIQIKGKWTDITDRSRAGNGRIGKDGWAVVHANVASYPDDTYRMRMFNRTRGIYDLALFDFQGSVVLEKDIYITPGQHTKNGRKWRTTCQPYSQTERCRTEIWATTVQNRAGKLIKRTGWVFNNLTYKESARSLWKNNPLGNTGKYVINGRKWRTECDTKATGRNGCRSYITATVVEAYRSGGTWKYRLVTKEVFNNIVMFKIAN